MSKPPAVALLRIPFSDKAVFCLWVNGVQVMHGTAEEFGQQGPQLVAERLALGLSVGGPDRGHVEGDVPLDFLDQMPPDYVPEEEGGNWNYDDLHEWFARVWVPAQR